MCGSSPCGSLPLPKSNICLSKASSTGGIFSEHEKRKAASSIK
jgi:hypothetical protein